MNATSVEMEAVDFGGDHIATTERATSQSMKFMTWITIHSIEFGSSGSLADGYGASVKANQTNGLRKKEATTNTANSNVARMQRSEIREPNLAVLDKLRPAIFTHEWPEPSYFPQTALDFAPLHPGLL